MYHGEVSVQEEELPALLKIAEALKVKGLVENDENKSGSSGSPIRTKPTQTTSGSGITPNSNDEVILTTSLKNCQKLYTLSPAQNSTLCIKNRILMGINDRVI